MRMLVVPDDIVAKQAITHYKAHLCAEVRAMEFVVNLIVGSVRRFELLRMSE